jgi:hypothetical protein
MTGSPAQPSEWVAAPPSVQLKFDLGHSPEVRGRHDLVPRCYELRGPLDIRRLTEALTRMRNAHDALRLRFHVEDGLGLLSTVEPGPALVRFQRLVGVAAERLPRAIPALGRQAAEQWDTELVGSASWTLLRVADDHHLLIGWYHRNCLDAKSVTFLERGIWECYFHPESEPVPSSFIAAALRRTHARERMAGDFWTGELERMPAGVWDPATISAIETVKCELADKELELLRDRAARDGLSTAQLLAHRFAAHAVELDGTGPVVIGHFVDDRETGEQRTIGNFTLPLPIVMGPEETASARASARKALRSFAQRPRRSGARTPVGFAELLHSVRSYGFNYVPAHYAEDVHPTSELTVTEFQLATSLRVPVKLDLRATETLAGTLRLQLSHHPDEIDAERAQAILGDLAQARR